jgi:DNA-binding HxlR family transcriptional regulator
MTLQPKDAGLIESAIKALSPIWTSAILLELASGNKRTKRILKALPGLSAKTFTERVRLLERLGLVRREYFREVPPRVEYSLTKEGQNAVYLLGSVKRATGGLNFDP